MMDNNTCPKFQEYFLPSIYSVECFMVLVGNLFALWLLLTRERNWHSGVVLSCNLVISDLLYGFTLPVLIDYYVRKKDWRFGTTVCKIERFLFNCNLYASIYFIMCISVNRCIAILHPFFTRTHVSPAKAKVASVIIWTFVIAVSSPVLKFATTCPAGNNVTHCVLHTYCDTHNQTIATSVLVYKNVLSVVGCFVPFLITFVSYMALLKVVWKNANITTMEKRKVALMVFAAIMMYAICFLPYHLIQSIFYKQMFYKPYVGCRVYEAYQVSKGLVTMNMCIHPLLYVAVFDSIKVTCFRKRSEDIVMSKT